MVRVDYPALLRSAFRDRQNEARPGEALYQIAGEIRELRESLPDGGNLSKTYEAEEQWAPSYLALDLALARACELMRMTQWLNNSTLRQAERVRIIHELDALGMFA